jgi:4a-hydroxytetrahydrobiopterin dehydratase
VAAKRAALAGRYLDENMPVLTSKQVGVSLKNLPNWSKRAETIVRTFQFEGFSKSITFVNRIAGKAQKCNHHPDIDVRFNKVTLTFTTHDEGGITEKDLLLARQCDEVLAKYFAPWARRIPMTTHE